MRSGVRVLDIVFQDLELVRLPSQNLDFGLELVVMGVDGILLLGGARALEQAVSDFDLQKVVQHVNLALEEKEKKVEWK